MVYDPSGRTKHVPQGYLLMPGECAICRNGYSERGFADTDLHIEFFGNVYFCEDCATNIASVFGGEPEAVIKYLKDKITNLEKGLVNQSSDLVEARNLNEQYAGVISSFSGVVRCSTCYPDSDASADSEGVSVSADGVSYVTGSDESESAEPVTDDGPRNAKSHASSDVLGGI